MRLTAGVVLAGVWLLAAACARQGRAPGAGPDATRTGQTNAPPLPAAGSGPSAVSPEAVPVTPVQGRVVFLNPRLRFVIVDFAFHQLPRLEQRLGVFRAGRRVGEVRISGPWDGTRVAADVMAGEADVGDLVRED